MQDLKVTLIQTALYWEDVPKNLNHFQGLMDGLKDESDVLILPEMFNTGFSMQTKKLAEGMDGKTIQWMRDTAREKNMVIVGSLIINEHGRFYNRLIWMRPTGDFEIYDKRHLFRMGNEHQHFSAGTRRLLVTEKEWHICPQVCYDLRFPVWNRNKKAEYDVLIFIANWPERRSFAWKNLLQARAIENQAYVIGINRIGNDGNDIYHSGDSALIDPLGEVIYTEPDVPFVKTFALSKERVEYVRGKKPFLSDADDFTINT